MVPEIPLSAREIAGVIDLNTDSVDGILKGYVDRGILTCLSVGEDGYGNYQLSMTNEEIMSMLDFNSYIINLNIT